DLVGVAAGAARPVGADDVEVLRAVDGGEVVVARRGVVAAQRRRIDARDGAALDVVRRRAGGGVPGEGNVGVARRRREAGRRRRRPLHRVALAGGEAPGGVVAGRIGGAAGEVEPQRAVPGAGVDGDGVYSRAAGDAGNGRPGESGRGDGEVPARAARDRLAVGEGICNGS